jgi:23S rRNA (adenine2030-N6)-methyltransferase
MNYRHAYHAGNFADVLKHAALTAVLLHLRKKETPFAVIDTHAGRGIYDLTSDESSKTGEAKDGILKILDAGEVSGVLGDYLECVGPYLPERYPGSPLIAAHMLRAKDRLIAIEKHADEFAILSTRLAPYERARVIEGDGYATLLKNLPPAERRGVVLIDPPFEDSDEFERAATTIVRAHKKFATGIYFLWYPMKAHGDAERASGELINAGIEKLLRIELDIGRAEDTSENAMTATGLLVVNPPYGFVEETERIVPYLRDALGRRGAKARVERLAWEP